MKYLRKLDPNVAAAIFAGVIGLTAVVLAMVFK